MSTQATRNNTWTTQLGQNHQNYSFVEFKRSHEHARGYVVVVVDVERLMECFERDSITLPRPNQWEPSKFIGIQNFLNPENGPLDMPVVGFSTRIKKTRRWLGLSTVTETVGVVGFTNGRHRSRYLQHAGAATMPVEVHESEAQKLLAFCAPR